MKTKQPDLPLEPPTSGTVELPCPDLPSFCAKTEAAGCHVLRLTVKQGYYVAHVQAAPGGYVPAELLEVQR